MCIRDSIATALSPWLWLPGFAIMGWMAWTRPHFIIWLILLASIPRLISLFRRRSEEEQRFFEITAGQRLTMAAMYFGLIGSLAFAMHVVDQRLHQRLPQRRDAQMMGAR